MQHQQQFEARPRENNFLGAIPDQEEFLRGRRTQGEAKPKEAVYKQQPEDKSVGDLGKQAMETFFFARSYGNLYFNDCAGWRHFSTSRKEPNLCFICQQTANYIGKDCP
jgi:hypothetical protein